MSRRSESRILEDIDAFKPRDGNWPYPVVHPSIKTGSGGPLHPQNPPLGYAGPGSPLRAHTCHSREQSRCRGVAFPSKRELDETLTVVKHCVREASKLTLCSTTGRFSSTSFPMPSNTTVKRGRSPSMRRSPIRAWAFPPKSRGSVRALLATAGGCGQGRGHQHRTGHQPPAGGADWRPHGPGERGRRGAHLLVGVPSRQAGLAAPRGSPSQRKLGGAGISCP
jgi:hypothetical protein